MLINLCSNVNSIVVNDFTGSFVASGFESLVNIPTGITDISATCMDHIYMKFEN